MPQDDNYYVYFLTNKWHTVLYIDVTNDLERCVWEHKKRQVKGFTYKYNVDKLVYFEAAVSAEAAALRRKQIKWWGRAKKDNLIASINPKWSDLSLEWYKDKSDV